jgi:hypothetical protein
MKLGNGYKIDTGLQKNSDQCDITMTNGAYHIVDVSGALTMA